MKSYLKYIEDLVKRKLSFHCNDLEIRKVVQIILDTQGKAHNMTTILNSMDAILVSISQLKDNSSTNVVKIVDETLLQTIAHFIEMLCRVYEHDMFIQYSLLRALFPNSFGVRQLDRVLNMAAERTVSNIIMTVLAPISRYDSEELYIRMIKATENPL